MSLWAIDQAALEPVRSEAAHLSTLRVVDLRDAIEISDAGIGQGLANLVLSNHDRPLAEVMERVDRG